MAPGTDGPAWMTALDEDDRQFVKRFVLLSGSLKDLAAQYGISYPTVRARLDRLIAKVKAADEARDADPLERAVRVLAADGRVSAADARQLLAAHKAALQQRGTPS